MGTLALGDGTPRAPRVRPGTAHDSSVSGRSRPASQHHERNSRQDTRVSPRTRLTPAPAHRNNLSWSGGRK